MDLGIKRIRGIEKNEMKPFHSKSMDATHISSLIQVYISFDEMKRYFMEKHYITDYPLNDSLRWCKLIERAFEVN
jgi:hypothetical protein